MKTEREHEAYLQGQKDFRLGWMYARSGELYEDIDLQHAYDLGYYTELEEADYAEWQASDY